MSSTEKRKEVLAFIRGIVDAVKGNRELDGYLRPITNPENPQTSSNLTQGQVSFIEDAHWISDIYPEMRAIKTSAVEIEKSRLSLEGFAIKQSVQLVSALAKTKETKETSVVEKVRERVKSQ